MQCLNDPPKMVHRSTKYDNVLGYEDDNSKIDVGAFALTKGRTITLNKFMFDDSSYLKREYEKAVEKRLFTKGTNYINVIDHEYGHIFTKSNTNIYNNVIAEIENRAYNEGKSIDEYIKDNISIYASAYNPMKYSYTEVIPEIYAMANGTERDFAIELLRKAGVLYENRSEFHYFRRT